jgi:hypothetical protein
MRAMSTVGIWDESANGSSYTDGIVSIVRSASAGET